MPGTQIKTYRNSKQPKQIVDRGDWQQYIDSFIPLFFITVNCRPGLSDTKAIQALNTFVDNLNHFALKRSQRTAGHYIKGFCAVERSRNDKYQTLHFHLLVIRQDYQFKSEDYFRYQFQKAIDFTNRKYEQTRKQVVIPNYDIKRAYQDKDREPWDPASVGVYMTKNFELKYLIGNHASETIGLLGKDNVIFGEQVLRRY